MLSNIIKKFKLYLYIYDFFLLSTKKRRKFYVSLSRIYNGHRQRVNSDSIQSNFVLLRRLRDKERKKNSIEYKEKESKSKRATATVQTNRADMIMFITAIARSSLMPIWVERKIDDS